MNHPQLRAVSLVGLVLALASWTGPVCGQEQPAPAAAGGQEQPVPAAATDTNTIPPATNNWLFPDFNSLSSLPERAWELLSQTPQPGQFGQGGQFGQLPSPTARYRVTWFPDTGVAGQPATLGLVSQDLGIVCPVYKDQSDSVALTTNVRSLLFHTNAVLPSSTETFPQDLWDVRFGVDYKHTFDNGWSAGTNLSFGSASDKPFHSVDELTGSVMAFLRIPVGEHNAWLFSVMYSPTGELPYPIPGVAFYWQPSDTFNASLGLPCKVVWKPIDGAMFEASYTPLTNVHVRGSYRLWGGVSVYAGYDNNVEAYYLADRTDYNDRFFVCDQRLTAGVKMQFGPHVVLDLSSGYSWDRHFFEAQSFSDVGGTRVNAGDTTFLSLLFEVRY
jgi:hypothetical protein